MKCELISYKEFFPKIGKGVKSSSTSTLIGNTVLGSKSILKDRVVFRGDGAEILVGEEVNFLERSTVHVASDLMGSYIGDNCIIAGQVGFAGSSTLGDNVMIGGQAGISGHLKIGNNVHIGGGSGFINNVSANNKVMGYPAKNLREFIKNNR